jgi:hypothetical protein
MRCLFTSASKPAALALARVLVSEGHVVHAVDVERLWGTAPARYSRAYASFRRLETLSDVPRIWKEVCHDIDIVIPFIQLPSHVRGRLEAMGANVLGKPIFENDQAFQDFVRDKLISREDTCPSVVKVPASFTIYNLGHIVEILGQYPTTTFSLQPQPIFDFDDEDTLVDLDSPTESLSSTDFGAQEPPLIISCAILNDTEVETIRALDISEARSCKMVEVVSSGAEYSAHVFVSNGIMRTFMLTAVRGTGRDTIVTSSSQPLFDIIYEFTKNFTEALNDGRRDSMSKDASAKDQQAFTGHLSIDLRIKDDIKNGEFRRKVTATGCSYEPHASLILLCSTRSAREQLAQSYVQAIPCHGERCSVVLPTMGTSWGLYSVSTAAGSLFEVITTFAPFKRTWRARLSRLTIMCCVKSLAFKEEVWDWRDPGPALCLWVALLVECIGQMPWVRTVGKWLSGKGKRLQRKFDDSLAGTVMKGIFFIACNLCFCHIVVLLQVRSGGRIDADIQ